MNMETNRLEHMIMNLRAFLKDRFNLDEDKAHENDTIEEIKKGVVFRGTNLWVLMFAIMVCSVGLNVNSTAVIIGAMLISPLMGPIMGIGLGVGINDLELIIKAVKNLGIATIISVLTSAIYFMLSPLSDAQSELLARTTPTMWDVLIAFFGGLAGIVASSRREKGIVIPGVAIATALMPPLCTAGFGLASGNWSFFFGAIYLFFINSVFISLATYLIVRFLEYPKKHFERPEVETRVKRYIALFVMITILPSIYTGYGVVQESVFRNNSNRFIQSELSFDDCEILSRHLTYGKDSSTIEVTLFGPKIEESTIAQAKNRMQNYGLVHTKLIVNQGINSFVDSKTLDQINQKVRSGILDDLIHKNERIIAQKDSLIRQLQQEIQAVDLPLEALITEAKSQHAGITTMSVSRAPLMQNDLLMVDTFYLIFADFDRKPDIEELDRFKNWCKARLKSDSIKFLID